MVAKNAWAREVPDWRLRQAPAFPVLLTILLATKPELRPRNIQAMNRCALRSWANAGGSGPSLHDCHAARTSG